MSLRRLRPVEIAGAVALGLVSGAYAFDAPLRACWTGQRHGGASGSTATAGMPSARQEALAPAAGASEDGGGKAAAPPPRLA